MKFALIYRTPLFRTESMIVEAESRDAISTELDGKRVYVEHLVDFENQTVTPVALTSDNRLIEVPEGGFGEATPAEYFEEEPTEE